MEQINFTVQFIMFGLERFHLHLNIVIIGRFQRNYRKAQIGRNIRRSGVNVTLNGKQFHSGLKHKHKYPDYSFIRIAFDTSPTLSFYQNILR